MESEYYFNVTTTTTTVVSLPSDTVPLCVYRNLCTTGNVLLPTGLNAFVTVAPMSPGHPPNVTGIFCATTHMTDFALDLSVLPNIRFAFAAPPLPTSAVSLLTSGNFFIICSLYLLFILFYVVAWYRDRIIDREVCYRYRVVLKIEMFTYFLP